jgi:hypothetical protein
MLQLTTSVKRELMAPDPKALIADRVRGEFREMPGLTLTLEQAARLWSLDCGTCTEVLGLLMDSGFLCRKESGAYGRASDMRPLRMARAALELVTPRASTA